LFGRNGEGGVRGLAEPAGALPPAPEPHVGEQPTILPSYPRDFPSLYFLLKIDHFAAFCRFMKKGKSALPLHFLVVSL
jgi:hypothetical protein